MADLMVPSQVGSRQQAAGSLPLECCFSIRLLLPAAIWLLPTSHAALKYLSNKREIPKQRG
jgi:hypothetical protein